MIASTVAVMLPSITQSISLAAPGRVKPKLSVSAITSDPNTILFRRNPLDTSANLELDTSNNDIEKRTTESLVRKASRELRVIQFKGPIKRRWIALLHATGAEVVGYLPNYAYIIRGGGDEISRVAALDGRQQADERKPVKWMSKLQPVQKIDPAFDEVALSNSSETTAEVEVELCGGTEAEASVERIRELSQGNLISNRTFLNYTVVTLRLPVSSLIDIASLEEVLFVGPAPRFRLQDEVSAQITAGNLTADGARPSGPGYWSWLEANGLSSVPDFLVDVADTGLDRGSTAANQLHPDLLDAQGAARVAYILNYANDGEIDDRLGHGSLVSSVVAGRGSTSREDPGGYMYGVGVDPFARLGVSRIFDHTGATSARLSFTSVVLSAYALGARVENNSWGTDGNAYDSAAQEYDALTRDADPNSPGNQEMTFVFAVGNNGPDGHVNSPAVSKNVIAVAAGESYRPVGTDSCNLDGGGAIGPEGADSALDILRYSSGGPTADGRIKPDITAPGTHIYGGASQAQLFFAQGLCPGVPVYQPPGQDLYTWSSGTSLAAPHIAGAAALVRRFFTSRSLLGDARPPSPAMTKAFLINSASYMTGANAGGDLPSPRQGWGLVNLNRAFEMTPRVLVDQTQLFTESGQTFEIQGSLAGSSEPLRVTLAWTDALGSLAGPALVNDLDLEIKVGDAIYRGNNFSGGRSIEGGSPDRLNNVESIYIPPSAFPTGAAGNFTVTVRAANIAGDGVPGNSSMLDQDFALIVTNIAPPIQEPPPGKKPPVIESATYVKKTLTIGGRRFSSAAQVEINGKLIDQQFEFDPVSNSLSIKLKSKKLNLRQGSDNQIVVIESGQRSEPYSLTL